MDADVVEAMDWIAFMLRALPPTEVTKIARRINIPYECKGWKPSGNVQAITTFLPLLVQALQGVMTGKLAQVLREGGDVTVKRTLHELFVELTSDKPREKHSTPIEAITIEVLAEYSPAIRDEYIIERDVDGPVGRMTLGLYEPGENLKLEPLIEDVKQGHSLLGLRHALAVHEIADDMPGSWRKFKLLFPGTTSLRGRRRKIPALSWWGDGWHLHEHWLCRGVGKQCRVVVPIYTAA